MEGLRSELRGGTTDHQAATVGQPAVPCCFLKPAPHLQAVLFVLVGEGFFQLRLFDRNHCPVKVSNREGEKNDWPDLFQ